MPYLLAILGDDLGAHSKDDFRGTLGIKAVRAVLQLNEGRHPLAGGREGIQLLHGRSIPHLLVISTQLLAKVEECHFCLAANECLSFCILDIDTTFVNKQM